MSEVSRECVRDTLLAKRQLGKHMTGIIRQVYNAGVQNLRAGQLSPHVEEKMRANRYLDMQALQARRCQKSSSPSAAGWCREVRSTNPFTQVWVADYDTDHDDEEEERFLSDAEERANEPDMHVIY